MSVLIILSYLAKKAATLASAIVVLNSIFALTGRLGNLHVSWVFILSLAVAVMLGARLGALATVGKKVKPDYIKYGYIVFLVLLFTKMIFQVYE